RFNNNNLLTKINLCIKKLPSTEYGLKLAHSTCPAIVAKKALSYRQICTKCNKYCTFFVSKNGIFIDWG
ncbi:hypothetical protein, partial [Pseudoalteromonas ruthenica]|uniref:hypothetical protein n=1 Tax=Pseudoalteromonas ruthenica TaxID=151081 RepID=UPI001BB132F2